MTPPVHRGAQSHESFSDASVVDVWCENALKDDGNFLEYDRDGRLCEWKRPLEWHIKGGLIDQFGAHVKKATKPEHKAICEAATRYDGRQRTASGTNFLQNC